MSATGLMPALVVTPRQANNARIMELPRPVAGPGEALVRVLSVGVCGTDAEIIAGQYGEAPPGQQHLVLAHESFGIVEALGPATDGVAVGDYVVGIVRHPDGCPNCQRGEWDMCLWGGFTERGIRAIDGFARPLYTETPAFLVPAPASLAGVGVLLEPLSVIEKAAAQITIIQRRVNWEPKTAVVLGAGPVGLLAAAVFRSQGLDTFVVATTPPPNPRATIANGLGAEYLSSREIPIPKLEAHLGRRIDIILEATGNSSVAVDALSILGTNGILCLASITGGNRTIEVPADVLNQRMVLGNMAVFGTVNANRSHYEAAVRDLSGFLVRWPGVIEKMVTHRFPLSQFTDALAKSHSREGIKVVLDLGAEA